MVSDTSDSNVTRPHQWQRQATSTQDTGSGNGGEGPPRANGDRLASIERRLVAIESEQRAHLRWTVLLAVGLASLFVVGIGVMMVRIDRAEDKISRVDDRIARLETSTAELPGKISQNLLQLNQTLFQAISASSSQKPQPIIVLPPQGSGAPAGPETNR